jgi:hypothetical protein
VSDAIVSGIFSKISGMKVYTIEDLGFMGIGRMIVIVTVRREEREEANPLWALFHP